MNAFSARTWNWRRMPLGLWALSFALLVWGPLKAEDCRQELTENLRQLQLASECEKSPNKCARYTGLFGASGPLLTVAILKVLSQLDEASFSAELRHLPELPPSAPTSKNKVLQGHYLPLAELYSRRIEQPSSYVVKNCQRQLKNSRKALDWIYQKSNRRQLDCFRDKMSFSPLEGPRIEVDLTNFSLRNPGFQNQDKRPELSLLVTEAAACCLRLHNSRSPLTAPSPAHCERHFWDPDAKSPLVSASRGQGAKGSFGIQRPIDGQK